MTNLILFDASWAFPVQGVVPPSLLLGSASPDSGIGKSTFIDVLAAAYLDWGVFKSLAQARGAATTFAGGYTFSSPSAQPGCRAGALGMGF